MEWGIRGTGRLITEQIHAQQWWPLWQQLWLIDFQRWLLQTGGGFVQAPRSCNLLEKPWWRPLQSAPILNILWRAITAWHGLKLSSNLWTMRTCSQAMSSAFFSITYKCGLEQQWQKPLYESKKRRVPQACSQVEPWSRACPTDHAKCSLSSLPIEMALALLPQFLQFPLPQLPSLLQKLKSPHLLTFNLPALELLVQSCRPKVSHYLALVLAGLPGPMQGCHREGIMGPFHCFQSPILQALDHKFGTAEV